MLLVDVDVGGLVGLEFNQDLFCVLETQTLSFLKFQIEKELIDCWLKKALLEKILLKPHLK